MRLFRLFLHSFLCSLCIIAINGCERRPLTYESHTWCDVRVNVDWTLFGDTPAGMTLMFFPEDGSEALVHTTNRVNSEVVSLVEGRYNVLVFNQSPDEFGCIDFRGMDKYETVEIFAREMSSKWYKSDEPSEKAVREPERIGVDIYEGFEVTADMVQKSKELYAKNLNTETASLSLVPECVISKVLVKVKVKGIHNIRSVRGSMSGMAEGFFPSIVTPTANRVTHILENWEIVRDDTDFSQGEVVTTFASFGLPSEISRAGNMQDHRLKISLLLVDNKTVRDFAFDVGDRIEKAEGEISLVVEVGIQKSETGEHPADKPIEIEDVVPEGGSEGGFDATVDDWGEITEVEIPL